MSLSEREKERLKSCVAKKDLVDGGYYIGHCRNATIARWNKELNLFFYVREKFGDSFVESIRHPEDEDGCDLFWPRILRDDIIIPLGPEELKLLKMDSNGQKLKE